MGESTLLCSDASATATLNNSNNKLQQQQLLQPPEKKKTRNNNQCSGIHTLIFVGQKLTKFKTKKIDFCVLSVCLLVCAIGRLCAKQQGTRNSIETIQKKKKRRKENSGTVSYICEDLGSISPIRSRRRSKT